MGKIIDLTNQTFGWLNVIAYDNNKHTNNKAYWLCKCKCGNIVSIRGQDLRLGKVKSCGCYNSYIRTKKNTKDLTNKKFNKLTAIKNTYTSTPNGYLWECKCDCGNFCLVPSSCLINNNTKSCGCLISYGENIISTILKEQNINFKSQFTFPDLKGDNNISNLRFDFAIFDNNFKLLCLIEFQGEQHYQLRNEKDTLENLNKRQRYDEKKRQYCKKNNIILIEIKYTDRANLNWEYINNLLIQNNVSLLF